MAMLLQSDYMEICRKKLPESQYAIIHFAFLDLFLYCQPVLMYFITLV